MRTLLSLLVLTFSLCAADSIEEMTKALREYADKELANDPGKTGKWSDELSKNVRSRISEANKADREAWHKVRSKEEWEKFRDVRIEAMRKALGTFPEAPKNLNVRVTKTIEGDGYRIDNCLYESRPGLWVAGNLYKPAKPNDSCPGIMICHSHHNPKHEGELQDMGVLWAKLGCYVLVIDQLGHGERRQHPFNDAKAYPDTFRVGRQDYWFRYNLGMQLSLVGESLIGWMAWDMMRGVDLLLKQPGIAKDKIILLGAVAGGGDPAAVTAALDPRINCVCPFNFGGPQPETKYPLPENAEETFNYAGGGSWESTRNIRESVKGGFLPWTIVASVAPRKVIHAHEFSWDQERDPVWKRYQKIFDWYGAKENLAFATGRGVIVGNDPNASHCNNIGAIHRQNIYAALKKWYGIPIPEKEVRERRSADELRCWTPDALKELQPKPLTALLERRADELLAVARRDLSEEKLVERFVQTQSIRIYELGTLRELAGPRNKLSAGFHARTMGFFLDDYILPITIFYPNSDKKNEQFPVVVALCQEGHARFVSERSETIARLLQHGCAVVLYDVRGIGAMRPGEARGRSSGATSISSSAQMLGESLFAQRLRDLFILLHEVRVMPAANGKRVALWGESFATPNAADAVVAVPHDADKQPKLAEPMAATLVSLAALQRPEVKAVLARGGLVSYRSVLESPFVYVPHDALPVRIFNAGDLPDVWKRLGSRVRLEGLINGRNQRVPQTELERTYKINASAEYSDAKAVADWLAERLKK